MAWLLDARLRGHDNVLLFGTLTEGYATQAASSS
jgi:hypothetical protein